MFPRGFFPGDFFAPRFFPGGSVPLVVVLPITAGLFTGSQTLRIHAPNPLRIEASPLRIHEAAPLRIV